MTKANLESLLRAYLVAVEKASFEQIVQCAEQFSVVLKQLAPIKHTLSDELKALVIELQNTHVKAIAIVRTQRDELKTHLEESPQYKSRATAYAKTQFAGQLSK